MEREEDIVEQDMEIVTIIAEQVEAMIVKMAFIQSRLRCDDNCGGGDDGCDCRGGDDCGGNDE